MNFFRAVTKPMLSMVARVAFMFKKMEKAGREYALERCYWSMYCNISELLDFSLGF